MHATTFALKRAHLRSVTLLRTMLDPFRVTPARMDLLYLVMTTYPFRMRQREIHRRLGVSPSTISRMLQRLRALGLVHHDVRSDDRRTKEVRVTLAGIARLRMIVRRVMRAGHVQQALDGIFRLPAARLRDALADFYADLRMAAVHFGDTSRSPYVATPLGDKLPAWQWNRSFHLPYE